MSEYNLISAKGSQKFAGTRREAIAAAKAMEARLQPSFGVTVELAGAEEDRGRPVCEIRGDGRRFQD